MTDDLKKLVSLPSVRQFAQQLFTLAGFEQERYSSNGRKLAYPYYTHPITKRRFKLGSVSSIRLVYDQGRKCDLDYFPRMTKLRENLTKALTEFTPDRLQTEWDKMIFVLQHGRIANK